MITYNHQEYCHRCGGLKENSPTQSACGNCEKEIQNPKVISYWDGIRLIRINELLYNQVK